MSPNKTSRARVMLLLPALFSPRSTSVPSSGNRTVTHSLPTDLRFRTPIFSIRGTKPTPPSFCFIALWSVTQHHSIRLARCSGTCIHRSCPVPAVEPHSGPGRDGRLHAPTDLLSDTDVSDEATSYVAGRTVVWRGVTAGPVVAAMMPCDASTDGARRARPAAVMDE